MTALSLPEVFRETTAAHAIGIERAPQLTAICRRLRPRYFFAPTGTITCAYCVPGHMM